MKISELKKDARVRLTGAYPKLFGMYLIYAVFSLITVNLISAIDTSLGTIPGLLVNLLVVLIEIPLVYGTTVSTLKAIRNDEVGLLTFVKEGFKNFGKVWKTSLRLIVRLLIPIIISIITYMLFAFFLVLFLMTNIPEMFAFPEGIDLSTLPTIPFSTVIVFGLLFLVTLIVFFIINLNYAVINLVLADNKELKAVEILDKSKKLMHGYKLKYVLVALSFILYYIGILAAFILVSGLNPYTAIFSSYALVALLNPYIIGTQICLYEEMLEEKTSSTQEA